MEGKRESHDEFVHFIGVGELLPRCRSVCRTAPPKPQGVGGWDNKLLLFVSTGYEIFDLLVRSD